MYIMVQKEKYHLRPPILRQSEWAIVMPYSFSNYARACSHQANSEQTQHARQL